MPQLQKMVIARHDKFGFGLQGAGQELVVIGIGRKPVGFIPVPGHNKGPLPDQVDDLVLFSLMDEQLLVQVGLLEGGLDQLVFGDCNAPVEFTGLTVDMFVFGGWGVGADVGVYYDCCTNKWGFYWGVEGGPGVDKKICAYPQP